MPTAICIVSYHSADDIAVCLQALSAQSHRDFEVVICENGGGEAFRRLAPVVKSGIARGLSVRAVEAPGNLGYAGGVNVCLREAADAEAWWVLNPDTQPQPGALEAMLERLQEGGCDLVGATVVGTDGRVQSRAGRWRPWLARAEAIGRGGRVDDAVDVDWVESQASYISGSSMLVSRRFLEAVGPMREDFFLYCEEVEWCLRALRLGLRIGYAPRAHVVHDGGASTGSVEDLTQRPRLPVYLDERNKILLTRDLYPERLVIAAAAALVLLILRFGKRRAWRQLGYAMQGWLAGLSNKRGMHPANASMC